METDAGEAAVVVKSEDGAQGKTQAEMDSDLFTKMKATERKRKPPPPVKKEEDEGEPCKFL